MALKVSILYDTKTNKKKIIHTVKTWDASLTSINVHILTKNNVSNTTIPFWQNPQFSWLSNFLKLSTYVEQDVFTEEKTKIIEAKPLTSVRWALHTAACILYHHTYLNPNSFSWSAVLNMKTSRIRSSYLFYFPFILHIIYFHTEKCYQIETVGWNKWTQLHWHWWLHQFTTAEDLV